MQIKDYIDIDIKTLILHDLHTNSYFFNLESIKVSEEITDRQNEIDHSHGEGLSTRSRQVWTF